MRFSKKLFLALITSIIFSLLPNIFFAQTSEYKINTFSNQLIYSNDSYDQSRSTILSIEALEKEDAGFTDLFRYYYYNQVVFGIRMKVENIILEEGCAFFTIPTFSIRTSEEAQGGYYLDGGLFYTYYSDDILGQRGYLTIRNGCDSFVFISDKFADYLLEKYNLNSYEELIKHNTYSTLVSKDENGNEIKLCINNIVYSDKRSAPRCAQLYGDFFSIIYKNNRVASSSSTIFEVDLKNSTYSCSRVLNELNMMGYSVSDYNFSFRKFESDKYVVRNDLNIYYNDVYKNSSDFISYFLLVISILISLLFCFYFLFKNSTNNSIIFFVYGYLLFFIILCLLTNFFYVYKYFYLTFLLNLFVILLFKGKELFNETKLFLFLARKKRFSLLFAKFKKIKI